MRTYIVLAQFGSTLHRCDTDNPETVEVMVRGLRALEAKTVLVLDGESYEKLVIDLDVEVEKWQHI